MARWQSQILNWNFGSLIEKRQVSIFQTEICFIMFICGNSVVLYFLCSISVYFLKFKNLLRGFTDLIGFPSKNKIGVANSHLYKGNSLKERD